MAFLTERFERKASDDFRRIMELQPKEINERFPFFYGTKNDGKAVKIIK